MKIQHLRFLAAVVEHGSVIRAAEALHVSQPAVSAGLHALEQELGRPLFERPSPGRRLKLLPGAEQLHRRALTILREVEAAKAEFAASAGDAPRFRIGVLPTINEADLTEVVGGLGQTAPNVRLQVWQGSPERLAAWLRQGRLDAAWTSVEELEPHADFLWREPVVGFVAPDHPIALRARPVISADDLRREPFVLRSSCELMGEAREAMAAAGIELPVAARIEQEEMAMRLVALGLGITIGPRSLLRPNVQAFPLSGLRLTRSIGLRWADGVPADLKEALLATMAPLRGNHHRGMSQRAMSKAGAAASAAVQTGHLVSRRRSARAA
ncbi:MAG: LysR family transcriptional regulator [Proteobacteria bacterium]|nr:LysR family transcriptional regulator [Pseudomonadota bacterium]